MLPIGDTEKQCGQPFDPGCKTDRKEPNSWKEMLEMSSISTGVNSQNKPLDILPLNGISHPPRNEVFKYEAGYHSKDATSLETVRTTPCANILISIFSFMIILLCFALDLS